MMPAQHFLLKNVSLLFFLIHIINQQRWWLCFYPGTETVDVGVILKGTYDKMWWRGRLLAHLWVVGVRPMGLAAERSSLSWCFPD